MEPEPEVPIVQVMEPEPEAPIVQVMEPEPEAMIDSVIVRIMDPEPVIVQVTETLEPATIQVVEEKPSPMTEPQPTEIIFTAVEDVIHTAGSGLPGSKKVPERRGTTYQLDDEYQSEIKRKKASQGGKKRKRAEAPKKERAERLPERAYNLRPRKKRT
jgi:hypothetical protein